MKKVSIIVPIYNVEKYLKRCIDSIINQTYKNLDIILVDDGSPDGCGKICDYYSNVDKRINVIHKKNGGLSDARNVGIENSTGDYIIFIDSDDYVKNNYVEFLLNDIESSGADISICDYIKDYDGHLKYNNYTNKQFVVENNEKYEHLYDEYYVPTVVQWNKIFKREIFDTLKFEVGKYNEDEFIICDELLKSKKISYNLEPLYYYFQRNDSIMGNFKIKRFDIVDAQKDRYEFFKKIDMPKLIEENNLSLFNTTLLLISQSYNTDLCIDDLLKVKERKQENKNFARSIIDSNLKIKSKVKAFFYIISPLLILYVVSSKKLSFIKRNLKYFKYFIFDFILTFINYVKSITFKDKIYVLGVPNHGNLGDQAIFYSEEKFLKENKKNLKIIGIYTRLVLRFPKMYRFIIKNNVILYTGGGFLGSLWENEEEMFRFVLKMFNGNKIIVLPQTFYFSDNQLGDRILNESINLYSKHKNLTIICREKYSYNLVNEKFKNNRVLLIPDMVLSLKTYLFDYHRDNVLICMRNDREKIVNNSQIILDVLLKFGFDNPKYTDTVINDDVNSLIRKEKVVHKLEEFSKFKLVITDRLHGMLFAYLTNTPCIVINSKSYKVKGVYEWIKACNYVIFSDEKNLEENIKKLLSLDEKEKINLSFDSEFKKLIGLIEGE